MSVYVLVNYNSTHEQDLYRVYRLREMGYTPYIMVYNKGPAPEETMRLQAWVNNKIAWRMCDRLDDFDRKGNRKNRRKMNGILQ